MVTDMFSTMDSNDLASLKAYFDSGESGVEAYTNAVEYSYSAEPQIYKENGARSARCIRISRLVRWGLAVLRIPTV